MERAVSGERAVKTERAVSGESTKMTERAATSESTKGCERADAIDGSERDERVGKREGTIARERAVFAEGASMSERARDGEGTVIGERPRYRPGYPHIENPSHSLWDDQQAGWPAHLAYEAWQQLAGSQSKADAPKASSADHPAFQQNYVPNYQASPEKPSRDYVEKRRATTRR